VCSWVHMHFHLLFYFYSEALGVINRLQHVAKGMCETGELRRLLLYSNGKASDSGCSMLPETCALISSIPASATCKRCQVY